MAAARPAIDLSDLGSPSERSAVIVRAALPTSLERVRRRSVWNAPDRVPAHLTMLYPFVAPDRLHSDVRIALAAVAARVAPFEYRLVGAAVWPQTVYVAVDPVEAFLALHRELQAAFPAFPIYGPDPGFDFVPHVTIAEGDAFDEAAILADPGWRLLPLARRAVAIEVITQPEGGRWRTIWRLPLGRMPA
jgi:2'-5' RNA ligase